MVVPFTEIMETGEKEYIEGLSRAPIRHIKFDTPFRHPNGDAKFKPVDLDEVI